MATAKAAKKAKTIKVIASYFRKSGKEGDVIKLWGTAFKHDGKKYCADVCPELFASLLDEQKVTKA